MNFALTPQMCECSEGTISSLLRKMPEMRGPKGETGLRGDTGDIGPPGLTVRVLNI